MGYIIVGYIIMENIDFTNVRVRIAPSPTGLVHVGNLRTILYNYLFAKHYNGKFIIRIEDTDQTRLVHGALENLLQVLKWAGIEADEGPYLTIDNKIKEKGPHKPYTQSQRSDIYKKQIQILLDKNKAYPCFCSKARLEKLREEQEKNKQAPKYDNFCRNLSREEAAALMQNNSLFVIRYKMPENREVVFKDIIRGDIKVNTADLDDYVLIKSDGFPTYHFANVVDDHFMKITHILRGEEWIASTPKHVLLYEAFGWQPPQFAHLPTLLNKQKKKLSKRDGDTAVQDFIKQGYLRDAFLNFIALLGWNAGTEQEVYTLNELIKQFSLDNVHKAGAVFDLDKLNWLNGIYLRNLAIDEYYELAMPYLKALLTLQKGKILINSTGEKASPSWIKSILALEQPRIRKIDELGDAVKFFFEKELNYSVDKLIWKKSNKAATIQNLTILLALIKKIPEKDFKKEKLENAINEMIAAGSIDAGGALWPMRFALSGQEKSAPPFDIAAVLGKKKTIERLEAAIAKLQ